MFEIYDIGFGSVYDDDDGKVKTVENLSEALYLCKSYQAQVGYPAQDIYIVLCVETGEEYYSDGTKIPEELRYLKKEVKPDFDPTHGLEYLGW